MDAREVVAAAQRIKQEAAAIAASDDAILTGQAIQICRLAEWLEELVAVSLGEVVEERRDVPPDLRA